MLPPSVNAAPWLLLLGSASVTASGLYTKNSPVLQIDSKNYDRLIARSNYTSVVEFYAPWCGHCKNLKPAFEKVATSLLGLAKVAAVNCDEDSNRPLCSSMGVQGFPTLKIVKPSTKNPAGKNTVEDYNGARTANAINDAVLDKIPVHVRRLRDEALDKWLDTNPERPKAIFYSEKAKVPAMVKALAIDFLGGIDFGYARDVDKAVGAKFWIDTYPSVLLIRGPGMAPLKHFGEFKKEALVQFFAQIMPPHPDSPPPREKKAKDSSKTPKATPPAASETIEPESQPTGSPDPNVATDVPKPVQVPITPPVQVTILETEDALQKACLHTGSTTCILALVDGDAQDNAIVKSLSNIATKHTKRGTKIFPFYSVPSSNAAGQTLVKTLFSSEDKEAGLQLLAINAKKAWWTPYKGTGDSVSALESWIDEIRMGDASKTEVPVELIKDFEAKAAEKNEAEQAQEEPHVDL